MNRSIASSIDRRLLLKTFAIMGTGLALPGCSSTSRSSNGRMSTSANARSSGSTQSAATAQTADKDVDQKIMTFALNLEYMEAEYYTRGAFGHSLEEHGVNVGNKPGEVQGGRKITFSSRTFQDYAEELAQNEAAHVSFYRKTLGRDAVDRPQIDFEGGFAAAAEAAGLSGSFDPFADEISFFLGGMLFEDVGITAYHGAAPLITSRKVLDAASGILAVEAYHMGMVRSLLYQAGSDARDAANAISEARDALDGPADLDQGIEVNGKANIVPCTADAIAFSRTPRQVLNIVYLKTGAARGGFYPQGMNGDFSGLI